MTERIGLGYKGKRIIIKERTLEPIVVPSLEALVTDAISIIGGELARYRAKVGKGISLDLKEARIVRDYVESLVKLTKEAREQAAAKDLSQLSNAELLQLAETLTNSDTTEKDTPKDDSGAIG